MTQRIELNGEWTLQYGSQVDPARSMSTPVIPDHFASLTARVPGNVELDLVRAGRLPENLEYSGNIYQLRKFEDHQWWYSRTFELSESEVNRPCQLHFEGLDTLSAVWLNGEKIAVLENMLIPHKIDVTGKLKMGENDLRVGIDSVVLEAREHPVDAGCWAMENNWESLSIRKAAHSFGWDIMPRIISAGIWRSVHLEFPEPFRFREVYVATTSVDREKSQAQFVVRWDVASADWCLDGWTVKVTVDAEKDDDAPLMEQSVPVLSHHGQNHCTIEPVDLWWPRGYGKPRLYPLRVELLDKSGEIRTSWSMSFGFRTIKLAMTETTNESGDGEFAFIVNNEKLFVKGSNWVPLDAFHSRDLKRLTETLEMAVDLNCNMIRCWGGNVYESNEFFKFCDDAGIMVWQDFAFGCALYPQTTEFHKKVRREAEVIIPHLRNHPSLALWAGNNEIDAFYTFAKPGSDPNLDDEISRVVLASACRRLDPWRNYLPSSPYFGPQLWSLGAPLEARPEDHLWGPRDDFKGSFYTSSNAHFASEIGYHGCPACVSLERMMSLENLWPWQNNEDWITHAVRPQRQGTAYNYRIPLMAHQIKVLFGAVPDSLEDFILASQVSQAEALKFFIERFRIEKGRRSGILWWNIRDGWPQISDAVVDYYGERKLAFNVVKQVQQDVCVMLAEPEYGLQAVVAVNDTLEPVEVEILIVRNGVNLIKQSVTIPANGKVQAGAIRTFENPSCIRIIWQYGESLGRNHYLAGPRPFDVASCREWFAEFID